MKKHRLLALLKKLFAFPPLKKCSADNAPPKKAPSTHKLILVSREVTMGLLLLLPALT